MARKGWNSLSPNYRQRLEKAGISKTEYESGASIRKARGHANTPERPYSYKPSQFPTYHNRRQQMEQAVQRRKEQAWSTRHRWSSAKSWDHIREKPTTIENLRWALNATDEELEDAIRETYDDFAWLGYH